MSELSKIQKARAFVADAFLSASGNTALTPDEVKAMLSIQNILDRVSEARVAPDFQEVPVADASAPLPADRDAILLKAAL